jgi:hypothetical protein
VLYGLLLLMIFYPGGLAQAYHQIRGWIENRGQPPRIASRFQHAWRRGLNWLEPQAALNNVIPGTPEYIIACRFYSAHS